MLTIVRTLYALIICVFAAEANAGLNTSCAPWPATGQPAIAAANNFNCLRHYDHFDRSLIDEADTGALGFRWYIHNTMPNSTTGNAAGTAPVACPLCIWAFGPIQPTPSTDWLIDGTGLRLSPVSNTPYHAMPSMFSTIRDDGAGGYRGKAFDGAKGFYIEAVVPAYAKSCGVLPDAILWITATEFVTAGSGNTADFWEIDFPEWCFGAAAVHWAMNGTTPTTYDFNALATAGSLPAASSNPVGLVVLPAALNGGVNGAVKWYVNGSVSGSLTVAPSETLFSNHFFLMLGAGVSNTQTVRSISVWTP